MTALELLLAKRDAIEHTLSSNHRHIADCKREIARFSEMNMQAEAELADVQAAILRLN